MKSIFKYKSKNRRSKNSGFMVRYEGHSELSGKFAVLLFPKPKCTMIMIAEEGMQR